MPVECDANVQTCGCICWREAKVIVFLYFVNPPFARIPETDMEIFIKHPCHHLNALQSFADVFFEETFLFCLQFPSQVHAAHTHENHIFVEEQSSCFRQSVDAFHSSCASEMKFWTVKLSTKKLLFWVVFGVFLQIFCFVCLFFCMKRGAFLCFWF